MKARNLLVAVAVLLASSSTVLAKSNADGQASSAPIKPIPAARVVADVNVVNPAAPAPAPAPVVVPVQPAPVQQAPVEAVPPTRKEVHEDVSGPRNYVGTIALSALLGGVAGAAIGWAVYELDNQTHARNIGFWAAGGVLAGTAVGVVQVVVQEDRASSAISSRPGSPDPAPTHRLALLRLHF